MRNRKIFNIIVILLTIFFIVSFVLSQALATIYFKNMFWASTALLMIGVILDLNMWSKAGLDLDKTKSSTIKRSFNDSTTLLVVFYGTLLLLIVLLNTFDKTLMENNYVIIIMFIMTIEFELFTYLSISMAQKDTIKLIKDNK